MRPPSGVWMTQWPGSNTPWGAPGAGTQRSGTHTVSWRGAARTGGDGTPRIEEEFIWSTARWVVVGPSGTAIAPPASNRSEEHTSELQSRPHLVCRLLLEKKKNTTS